MFIDTSRRRSPSTANFATCDRSEATSASVKSFTLTLYFTPAASQMRAARLLPMPNIWVNPMRTCLFIGMLMPAIRAIYFSPLRTTTAHAKKRVTIYEKHLDINSLAITRADILATTLGPLPWVHFYPWRCLCRGSDEQMMYTMPRRRTILQFL